jgi:Peroxisomal membrane protein (Pex16)
MEKAKQASMNAATSARAQMHQMPQVLKNSPQWLHMYGDFITKNAGAVSQIESALRSLTYIIPGT